MAIDSPTFTSLEELAALVRASGDIVSVPMEKVRDAYGAGRLGIHVRDGISKKLHGMGLGHFPTEIPESQWALVRIYRLGSQIADLVDAVLNPGAEHDEELRQAIEGESADVLRQVRELVCR
jgi:hypothetical protein